MWNINALALTAQKVISKVKVFKKMGQTPRSKSQGKKYWYPQKGLITGNIHVKYQSSSTHCLKVISKVKVFKKWVKLLGQGHRVKNNGTHKKFLSQGIFICEISKL